MILKTKKQRFMERVHVHSGSDPCWTWADHRRRAHGLATTDQIAQKRQGQKGHRYYRVAWMVFKGRIKKGQTIFRLCGNTKCVNPAHLGTVNRRLKQKRNPDGTWA